MYASPAWWGFTGTGDRQRFERLLARLRRCGFLPRDFPSIETLAYEAERKLLKSISQCPMSDKSICSLFERANQELIIIAAWFIANKFSVNLSKTNYILFRSHRKVVSMSDLKLEIDDKEIMQVRSSKFLGVYNRP